MVVQLGFPGHPGVRSPLIFLNSILQISQAANHHEPDHQRDPEIQQLSPLRVAWAILIIPMPGLANLFWDSGNSGLIIVYSAELPHPPDDLKLSSLIKSYKRLTIKC